LLLQGTTFAQQGTLTDDSTYPQGVGSNQVLVVQGPNAVRNQPAASAFVKFKLTGSWDEGGTTDPPYDTTKPVITGVLVTSANTYLAFDITPLVKQWLDFDLNNPAAGGLANNGIAIVPAKDAAGAFVNPSMIVQFDSKESGKTSHESRLSVLLDHVAEADHAQNADNATYATTAGTANALASSATVDGSQIISTVATANGGTGLASSGVAGNILRSDGSKWTSAPLQASDVPGGSGSYIQNTTTQQANSSFNISGNGTVGGNLAANTVTASTQYNIGNNRVLSIPGGDNFFAGVNAGTFNTSGVHNAFFGPAAGRDNTVGYENSFFGFAAGLSNTAGVFNSFFGSAAGISNSTGGTNAFFGANAGRTNSTGGGNAFFGHAAGRANTTGSLNSFVGDNAGASNTTGSNNTFIGAFSDGAAGIANATAIGANAKATQSNSMVLGNNANVGIGTSAPQAKLHVEGGSLSAGKFTGNVEVNGNLNVTGNITGGVPVGTVVAFAGPAANIPAGWAVCDGAAISRTGEFADLFATIGTAWGAGDGSVTFNLPDLRGMFLRGVNGGAGNDPDSAGRAEAKPGGNTGDAVGSVQADQYRLHNHGVNDPGHSHNAKDGHKFAIWHPNGNHDFSDGSVAAYQFNGIATPLMNKTAGAATGISITQSGGNESRPRNVYVYYIVKVSR